MSEEQRLDVAPSSIGVDEGPVIDIIGSFSRIPSMGNTPRASPTKPTSPTKLTSPTTQVDLARGYFMAHYRRSSADTGEVVTLRKLTSDSFEDRHVFECDAHMTRLASIAQHPNILNMVVGCEPEQQSPSVMMLQAATLGVLQHCLRDKTLLFLSLKDRLAMCRDATLGLQHLQQLSIVHTKLTTAACFVTSDMVIKIGDLSSAYQLIDDNVITPSYSCQDVHVPGRDDWLVPHEAWEVLFDNQIRSSSSDVWSLGTLMWSVFASPSQHPFDDAPAEDMLARIVRGERLGLPAHCPAYVHELMQRCWTSTCGSRISCEELLHELNVMLDSPVLQPPSVTSIGLSVCAEPVSMDLLMDEESGRDVLQLHKRPSSAPTHSVEHGLDDQASNSSSRQYHSLPCTQMELLPRMLLPLSRPLSAASLALSDHTPRSGSPALVLDAHGYRHAEAFPAQTSAISIVLKPKKDSCISSSLPAASIIADHADSSTSRARVMLGLERRSTILPHSVSLLLHSKITQRDSTQSEDSPNAGKNSLPPHLRSSSWSSLNIGHSQSITKQRSRSHDSFTHLKSWQPSRVSSGSTDKSVSAPSGRIVTEI